LTGYDLDPKGSRDVIHHVTIRPAVHGQLTSILYVKPFRDIKPPSLTFDLAFRSVIRWAKP